MATAKGRNLSILVDNGFISVDLDLYKVCPDCLPHWATGLLTARNSYDADFAFSEFECLSLLLGRYFTKIRSQMKTPHHLFP